MTVQTPLDPTPPPAPAPTPRRRSTAALAVSIVTIVIGGCAILGTLGSSGLSAIGVMRDNASGASVQQSETRGVRDLDIDVTGGALSVEYGDVSEAQLDGDGAGVWTLERRGDTLHVSSPDRGFRSWSGGASATLTLPQSLVRSGVDARIDVTGGSLDATGDFGAVSVKLSGGTATLSGHARSLDLSVAGGSASADVSDVDTAAFELAGGDLTATLTGSTPTRTTIDVTAGSVDLTLPEDTYRVIHDGPGSLDSALATSSTATPRVDVQTALGSVTLRAS